MKALDAEVGVGAQLGEHLVGVADERRAAAAARAADAGPEMVLDEALVVGGVAHLGLAAHAVGGVVERALADRVAGRRRRAG